MISPAAAKRPLAFLEGGGEMGERTRAFDWASTPLGAPETWPVQLKTMVRLLLSTRQPMLLWWGPQLIQFYNDAYARSIGPQRHPSALGQCGHECWEGIWPFIGPRIEQVMQGRGDVWSENEPAPITRSDIPGETHWTCSYGPIDQPDAPHGVGGVLAVCTETSAQTVARHDPLAEHDQLKELFQQAPGFMALLRGPQHVFEMVNPAYMRLVGNQDLLGKTVADALPDTVKQGYVDLLDEVYRSGKAFTTTGARFEFTGANTRRVERYVDFVYQPITDTGGAVTGIFMEGFDVTSAHSDAEAVRELYDTLEQRVADAVTERNILADVVEFSETHTMAIDLCYYVLAVNKSYSDEFESLYGHRPQVGDNLLEMLKGDPARGERMRGFWDRAINGEDFHVSETFGSTANDMRHYDMRFNALKDRSGKRVGAFVVVYDVTDRASEQARLAEAEARVRQAQKIEAIGQLTGGVAHDFNNLLMVISGGLEVMDELAPARREKVIAGMRQAVEKGAGLSRQLLAFSRRQPLRPEAVNLARKIGGMREMLDRSLRGDVHVEVAFDGGLWPVEVDPGQLELVVLNLAVNARDAMPGGGTIRIGARNAPALNDEELFGDYVELSIADTGTGMMPEVLARVFEPFFTTKEIGKGSGLGLAQAHGFAKSSRGAVRIDSEPRKGTTVFLYLPRTDKSPLGDEEEKETEAPGRIEIRAQGSLLLVEDDDEVAALTGEMLATLGYEVTRVENADAALGALAGGKSFGIVFSDVMMPGQLDGIDLSQEIRLRRPGLPVVLTTGHVEAAKQKAEALGVSVLPKPYRLQELETALGDARKQAQDTSPA
ncbi:PAS domain-containing protein [Pseudoxanthomonas sp. CF125]|uniref:PAS domain-containing protein n=1 Tax=Pseudoxanthomonas sp. CF125 TaxID=1855303 RepID=UPI00088E557F|nr:PAS domain-containing protein [Pseudoxanthomonas sp. CF125]SDQ77668.1 Signal transduction histidine kinase [Pseudoxanthomonas sp. CF125]